MVYCNTAKRKLTFKKQGMKKTAMQLLIEFMHGAYSKHDIHKKATELLETERDDHEHAFNESRKTHPMVGFKHDTFEQYYKDTYQ
jgi:hypothetical protein